MYAINLKKELLPATLIVLSFVAGLLVYPSLPQQLPIHWNIHGAVDGYINKSLPAALLFPLMTLGIYLLLLLLPYIDPKRDKYAQFTTAFHAIRLTFTLFFLFLFATITISSLGYPLPTGKLIPGAVALLIIVMGNFMGKIRHNYFIGIRLPWTFADEQVWNKTHRLGGKLFVISGICTLASLALPEVWCFSILMGTLALAVIVITFYAYAVYRKIQTHA